LLFFVDEASGIKHIYCTMGMIYADKIYLIQFSRRAATTGRSDSIYSGDGDVFLRKGIPTVKNRGWIIT